MSTSLRQANRVETEDDAVGVGGASNVEGPNRTGEPALTIPIPSWLRWVRNGVLYEDPDWPQNYGITPGIAYGLEVLGRTAPLTIIEHGEAGTSLAGWAQPGSAIIDELVAEAEADGKRIVALCLYLGSADANAEATADAARASVQTVVERARAAFGAGMGAILGGLHTPEEGIVAYEDTVDEALLAFANAHSPALCAYFRNRDAEIQGGGSDHLSGGDDGGAVRTGMRYAQILWESGVVR